MSEPNFKNRTMWTGDNLDIMRGMNSESVDLIYLDPPFNSKRNYSAPIGSEAAGAAFKDTWTLDDVDEAWHGEIADKQPSLYSIIDSSGLAHGKGMKSYLIMMAVRLIEMKRLLKDTGSIYLHCDPTASHYLKLLMDTVFGTKNFRNEIVWWYRGNSEPRKTFPRKHDVMLFYGMPSARVNRISLPYAEATIRRYNHVDGEGRRYKISALRDGRQDKVYMKDGKAADDVWDIPIVRKSKERIGYPTQKPLALLNRIIQASSNTNDMVLDPFCGCATTCVSADKLNRQWVGIDISHKASELVNMRLQSELGDLYRSRLVTVRTDVPKRTDMGELPNYRTHKHVLYGKQEGKCGGCRSLFQFRNFTIDHIIPDVKGGTDHPENLQLLCGACNSAKGANTQEHLISKLKVDGIL